MSQPKVPVAIVAIAVALAAVAWIQGLRAASDRHARLQPARAGTGLIAAGDSMPSFVSGTRFALIELGRPAPARLALYQWMPSRTLLRWVESERSLADATHLVVPLEGLAPGEYALCRVGDDAAAGPREMDLPAERLDVVARLRLLERPDRR